jgi:hypothetical protein
LDVGPLVEGGALSAAPGVAGSQVVLVEGGGEPLARRSVRRVASGGGDEGVVYRMNGF